MSKVGLPINLDKAGGDLPIADHAGGRNNGFLKQPVFWTRIQLFVGRPRRFLANLLRPRYVRGQLKKRDGGCVRCGACCQMGSRCNSLDFDVDGLAVCLRYDDHRPVNCRTFPISGKDLRDRDVMMPDRPCGYRFQSPGA